MSEVSSGQAFVLGIVFALLATGENENAESPEDWGRVEG